MAIRSQQRLVANLALRQCLLELLDAFLGDLCAVEVKLFELCQAFQMYQPGSGDLGSP